MKTILPLLLSRRRRRRSPLLILPNLPSPFTAQPDEASISSIYRLPDVAIAVVLLYIGNLTLSKSEYNLSVGANLSFAWLRFI